MRLDIYRKVYRKDKEQDFIINRGGGKRKVLISMIEFVILSNWCY